MSACNDNDKWAGFNHYTQELERIARWNEKAATVISVVTIVLIFFIIAAAFSAKAAFVVMLVFSLAISYLVFKWDGK